MRQPITFTPEEITTIAQFCDLKVDEHLTFVNKKYAKSIHQMTQVPYLRLKSNYDIKQCNAIKRSFKVFENAEECNLYSEFLTQFSDTGCVEYMFTEEFQRMQQIHLYGLPEAQEAVYMLQEQITKITTSLCYYDDLDLSEYPNLKELTLDFGNDAFDFKSIFYNLYEPLDVVRIRNFGDLELLAQCLGKMMFARKVFLYVSNVSENDSILKQFEANKRCKVIIENDVFTKKTYNNDYLSFSESDEMDNISYNKECYSDEYQESEDEYSFYNDEFIYNGQSTEDENKYKCFISQEDENSELFNFNDVSSDSMDCGKTLITKVELTASMCDSECSYDGSYAQISPFITAQF